jgi:putative membrane protein
MVVLLVIAFVFGSQNTDTIMLNYLISQTEMTIAHAVSIFTLLGFFLGIIFCLFWRLVSSVRSHRVG